MLGGKSLGLFVVAALAGAQPAWAVTIGYNTNGAPPGGTAPLPHDEAGFTSFGAGAHFQSIYDSAVPALNLGSDSSDVVAWDFRDTVNIERVGGGAFRATSIEVGRMFAAQGGAGSLVLFAGLPAGGGPQSNASFVVPIGGMATVDLLSLNPAFGNITRLVVSTDGTIDGVLDNVQLEPVPEPSTLVLGLVSFVGAAVARRRARGA